jgi:hypothetical protein
VRTDVAGATSHQHVCDPRLMDGEHAGGGPPVAWRLGEHEDAHGGEERGHDELAEVARPALGVGEVHHFCSAGREEPPGGFSKHVTSAAVFRLNCKEERDLRRTKIWAAASAAACSGWWAASAAAASAQGRRDENPAGWSTVQTRGRSRPARGGVEGGGDRPRGSYALQPLREGKES